MSLNSVSRQLIGITAGVAIAVGSTASAVVAQNATEDSMHQAGYNAGLRLQQAGYDLTSLDGAPYYTAFLANGDVRTVSVDIPYTGEYVLLIGAMMTPSIWMCISPKLGRATRPTVRQD